MGSNDHCTRDGKPERRASIVWHSRLRSILLIGSALGALQWAGCGAPSNESTSSVRQRATASSTAPSAAVAAPCTIGALPSTKAGKSKSKPCQAPKPVSVSQVKVDKQAAYLKAWKAKREGAWKALSAEQREQKRRKLKASIYAGVAK